MLEIYVHGPDPEDIRAEDEHRDDGVRIANDIHRILQENYEYLDVEGVEVDTSDASLEDAPDFPDVSELCQK